MTTSSRIHRALLAAIAAVVALDVLGLVVAVATDLASFGDAFVSGTPINAPFVPFVAIQVALAAAALQQRHRRVAIAAAALLALACAVSVFSGTQDGSYGADELTPAMTVIQMAIVVASLAATLSAGLLVARGVRRVALAQAS
jgi:peptidoglycan/LPS O-acetylase OafA/YrhL